MKRLWIAFAVVLTVSFTVLGWIGTRIYEEAPPIANTVATTDGKVFIDAGEIQAGQGSLNGGLMMMCILSLLPVGLMQTWASVEHGYWYARSSEFLQTPLMQQLRWMRVPGDTVFFLGAVALVVFVAGLKTSNSFRKEKPTP